MSTEMKLYIKVVDGLPINHPAFEINLVDAFGAVPPDWEPFIRIPDPAISDRSIVLTSPEPVYRKINGVWQDYWFYRSKTPEELEAQRQDVLPSAKAVMDAHPYAHNFTAWSFSDQTLKYEPPFPKPEDGKFYRWHGPSNNWREAEPFPNDGKKYRFDFDNWVNVEIV